MRCKACDAVITGSVVVDVLHNGVIVYEDLCKGCLSWTLYDEQYDDIRRDVEAIVNHNDKCPSLDDYDRL